MVPRNGPTLRAQWLGQQLRELRDANELTLKQVADYLQCDPSTLSRFESAEYPIRRPYVMALLDLYGVSEQRRRDALMRLSEEVWQKGWWDGYANDVDRRFIDYVWLESRAREIRTFDDTLLPGLLQTPGYARAAIQAAEPHSTAEQAERGVELRMTRQQVLTSDDPPCLRAILDEALLHRQVGGPAVLHEQLTRLTERAQLVNVDIRVLPFRAGAHASPTGAFKIFTMADPYPDVAYAETLAGSVYVETPGADRFAQAYDRLHHTALEPDESADLISALAEEMAEEPP
jgi:transcriptional regulator with XRE-family HTH domain